MKLTIELKPGATDALLPADKELAQEAGSGVSETVKSHLAERDRIGRRDGLPSTGYWGDAAADVTTAFDANRALVSIHKEGVALHYYGGVVYPVDAKALAIPKTAAAAGKRPAEYDPDRSKLALVWPEGARTGSLRDKETGETVYLLVSKATIKADKSVLPDDAALLDAAERAMESII